MMVKKAKPKNNIVSPAKPMPSITEKEDNDKNSVSFRGPGLNVKSSKSYKKGGK